MLKGRESALCYWSIKAWAEWEGRVKKWLSGICSQMMNQINHMGRRGSCFGTLSVSDAQKLSVLAKGQLRLSQLSNIHANQLKIGKKKLTSLQLLISRDKTRGFWKTNAGHENLKIKEGNRHLIYFFSFCQILIHSVVWHPIYVTAFSCSCLLFLGIYSKLPPFLPRGL